MSASSSEALYTAQDIEMVCSRLEELAPQVCCTFAAVTGCWVLSLTNDVLQLKSQAILTKVSEFLISLNV